MAAAFAVLLRTAAAAEEGVSRRSASEGSNNTPAAENSTSHALCGSGLCGAEETCCRHPENRLRGVAVCCKPEQTCSFLPGTQQPACSAASSAVAVAATVATDRRAEETVASAQLNCGLVDCTEGTQCCRAPAGEDNGFGICCRAGERCDLVPFLGFYGCIAESSSTTLPRGGEGPAGVGELNCGLVDCPDASLCCRTPDAEGAFRNWGVCCLEGQHCGPMPFLGLYGCLQHTTSTTTQPQPEWNCGHMDCDVPSACCRTPGGWGPFSEWAVCCKENQYCGPVPLFGLQGCLQETTMTTTDLQQRDCGLSSCGAGEECCRTPGSNVGACCTSTQECTRLPVFGLYGCVEITTTRTTTPRPENNCGLVHCESSDTCCRTPGGSLWGACCKQHQYCGPVPLLGLYGCLEREQQKLPSP